VLQGLKNREFAHHDRRHYRVLAAGAAVVDIPTSIPISVAAAAVQQ